MIPMTKARAEELIVPLKNGKARDISNAWRARLIEALEYVIQHDRQVGTDIQEGMKTWNCSVCHSSCDFAEKLVFPHCPNCGSSAWIDGIGTD